MIGTEIREGTKNLTSSISYSAGSGRNTTALVKKMGRLDGIVLTYYYDQMGNIVSVGQSDDGYYDSEMYNYDVLGQLTRADRYDLGKTVTYSYDAAGNITEKQEYVFTEEPLVNVTPSKTITYIYGDAEWKDLLTAYDGKSITYDRIGNPLSYYNGMSFDWSDGRKLTSVTLDGKRSMTLEYDENGMRSKKTIENVEIDGSILKAEYSYYYTSGRLVGMWYKNWLDDFAGGSGFL